MLRAERPLTERQRAVLQFFAAHETCPSTRETMDRFGWTSTMAVTTHVRALLRRGFIERVSGLRDRPYKLTVRGHVAAGSLRLPVLEAECAERIAHVLEPMTPEMRARVVRAVRILAGV